MLKKILPDELKNMEKNEIKVKKVRRNSFVNIFGNTILNLYNKEKAKKKENTENSESNDKYSYNSLENSIDNITKDENKNATKDNQQKTINANNKTNENNNNKINDVNIDKNKNIANIKKISNEKEEIKIEKKDNVEKIKNKKKSENLINKDDMETQTYNPDENYNSYTFKEQNLRSINSNLDKKNSNNNIQRIRIAR